MSPECQRFDNDDHASAESLRLAAGTPCEVSGSMAPRFLSLLLGLAAAATTFPTRAASGADASPSAPYPPKLFVEAQLGLGTPGGAAGGALEPQAGPLGLSVGAGEGFSGPQVAGMLRYRFWLKPDFNINIGAGMSAGRYEWVEFSFYDTAEHKLWDVAYWGNAEAGVEMGSRFRVRVVAGLGSILNRDAGACVGITPAVCQKYYGSDGLEVPYIGVAFAYGLIP